MSDFKNFDQQKQKLETLWNLLNNQDNILANEEEIRRFLHKNHINDRTFTVFESDFKNIQIGESSLVERVPSTAKTTTKSGTVSTELFYDFLLEDLNIPEYFFPFLNYKVIAKSIPTSEILSTSIRERKNWINNEIVTVAGTQIYNGIAFGQNKLFNQNDIDNGTINEDATRNIYDARNGASGGNVTKITLKYDAVSGLCSTKDDHKRLTISYQGNIHQITSFTTLRVEGIGDIVQVTHNASCTASDSPIITNGSVALDFADAFDITINTEGADFTVAPTQVTFKGFRLYYGTTLEVSDTGTGLFFKTVGTGIDNTLERVPANDVGAIILTPNVVEEKVQEVEVSNIESGFFQLNEKIGEDINKYKLFIKGSVILQTNITESNGKVFIVHAKNTFNWNGSSYVENLSGTGSFSKEEFKIPNQDIQFKVIVTLKNPFYYRLQENYRAE